MNFKLNQTVGIQSFEEGESGVGGLHFLSGYWLGAILISFCPIRIQRSYQTPVRFQIPLSLLLPLKSAF